VAYRFLVLRVHVCPRLPRSIEDYPFMQLIAENLLRRVDSLGLNEQELAALGVAAGCEWLSLIPSRQTSDSIPTPIFIGSSGSLNSTFILPRPPPPLSRKGEEIFLRMAVNFSIPTVLFRDQLLFWCPCGCACFLICFWGHSPASGYIESGS